MSKVVEHDEHDARLEQALSSPEKHGCMSPHTQRVITLWAIVIVYSSSLINAGIKGYVDFHYLTWWGLVMHSTVYLLLAVGASVHAFRRVLVYTVRYLWLPKLTIQIMIAISITVLFENSGEIYARVFHMYGYNYAIAGNYMQHFSMFVADALAYKVLYEAFWAIRLEAAEKEEDSTVYWLCVALAPLLVVSSYMTWVDVEDLYATHIPHALLMVLALAITFLVNYAALGRTRVKERAAAILQTKSYKPLRNVSRVVRVEQKY